MQTYRVHGKVDNILKEFTIINPSNLVFNEAQVPGELEASDGKKLLVTRTIINFPNGMQLKVEESPEELTRLFGGDSGTNDTDDAKE